MIIGHEQLSAKLLALCQLQMRTRTAPTTETALNAHKPVTQRNTKKGYYKSDFRQRSKERHEEAAMKFQSDFQGRKNGNSTQ